MKKKRGLPRCSKKGEAICHGNLLTFLRMKNTKGVFTLLFKFLVGIS